MFTCSTSGVRKNARFAHIKVNYELIVREKRFSAHEAVQPNTFRIDEIYVDPEMLYMMYHIFLYFSLKLFVTTLMLLNAIIASAAAGFSRNPVSGYNTPAAS